MMDFWRWLAADKCNYDINLYLLHLCTCEWLPSCASNTICSLSINLRFVKKTMTTTPEQAGQCSVDRRGWEWEGGLLLCSFCSNQLASCCQSCLLTSTTPWWSHWNYKCSIALWIPGIHSWSLPVTEFEQELSCQPNKRQFELEVKDRSVKTCSW